MDRPDRRKQATEGSIGEWRMGGGLVRCVYIGYPVVRAPPRSRCVLRATTLTRRRDATGRRRYMTCAMCAAPCRVARTYAQHLIIINPGTWKN